MPEDFEDASDALHSLLGQDLEALIDRGQAHIVAGGLVWAEGPCWVPETNRWLFSDIPNNRLLGYSQNDGLSIFRFPANNANGNFPCADGGFLSCEHLSRRVTKTAANGEISVICDRYQSKKLNSPNDVVEASDGSIWFTDPTYGILTDFEGKKAASEQDANRVYRVDPQTGHVSGEISDLTMPNGLCFSPDGKTLYVADSGADLGPEVPFDNDGPRDVFAYEITKDMRVTGMGRHFCRVSEGVPDGIRCDRRDRLWVASGAGIECFCLDGSPSGILKTSDVVANLAFGGPNGRQILACITSRAVVIDL
jgi:gluconolactonase